MCKAEPEDVLKINELRLICALLLIGLFLYSDGW